MLSLARQRLSALFHKPRDTTMDFDSWNGIVDRLLFLSVSSFLFHFTDAAKNSLDPQTLVLDRLIIVWMWLNKDPNPPEHEFLVIETEDSQDKTRRLFIYDRSADTTKDSDNSNRPTTSNYGRLENNERQERSPFLPSRSGSPLASMEEGLSTYPPVSLPPSEHSMVDTLSLGATKASKMVSDSLDKGVGSNMNTVDRILGESYIQRPRYGKGRNARQIKPHNLTMFDFAILAAVVHDFAPMYTQLDKNCYWSANIMMDSCIEIFGLDNSISPGDDNRKTKYARIDAHLEKISGHWKGWKVSHTKADDLAIIVQEYKKALPRKIAEVEIFFF